MNRSLAVAIVGVVAAGVAMAEEIVDFARDGHGWRAANHVANIRQTATGYAFDVTDVDPWCVASATYAMPSPPAGAAYLCIELETAPVENPVSFQIYWHAEKPLFSERESAHLKPVGPSPCTTFVAELPVGLIGSVPVALRIDPPGKGAAFTGVEFRRLCASYVCAEWTPNFSAPPPIAFIGEPLVLKGDGWELRHDRTRMGAFAFVVNGKTWAEGYPNEPVVAQNANGKPEALDWSKGEIKVKTEGTRIEARATVKDHDGRTWTWSRSFTSSGKALSVRTAVSADRPAHVYHIPYMTLFVDRASNGRKKQALLPGIEYLADEPSSNEKEVRGPQANRLIPAAHKFCYPMMAIADDTSWFALEWTNPNCAEWPFAPVFDTPDRQFKSGGHLFALWAPGIGPARRESDLRVFSAVPFTSGEVEMTFSTGAGGDVVDVLASRYPLARFLPFTPELDAAKSCDVLARGWLDSGIRDGARGCRHALGSNWHPYRAADVPALMLWLASATPDAEKSAQLSAAANEMIAAFPEGSAERRGWGGSVSHVKRPAAPLVFGDPLGYSAAQGASAKRLALQLADGKRIWRKPGGGKPDLGETLGADHCNGYTAISVSDMLSAALWTGDEKAIADALAVLDKFTAIYGNDVPRGAQPWEMPLHTPDILASGRLVECYVKGYLLSGDARYLERARYWARTGMTMVYFVDPPTNAPNPIGRYATIGVIGATHWVAPNWIGLPVQWCGLVYSAALADLAVIETDAELASLWRHLANGITASGVDQSYLPSDGEKVGLLPDSFNIVSQERRDPPINPGTLQENVSNFIGLPYYRVVRAAPDGKTLVHVPGRATARAPQKGELARVEIAAWPKAPYKAFFSRVTRPSSVKANGVAVPFEFRDNVMSVSLQCSSEPVLLALEK
jgi:hypothetical protein